MNDKIEEKAVILPPFKHMIMTIGELPTSYIETMTYYEMLVWFTNYLGKTVIPAINENGEAVIELQNLFVKLQTYVNNYFDNLDVQEEINNKLDQMLEDGVLEQIIEQYIQSSALWGFDTVADMKSATNLINGSYARTLGYYSKNDGGGATYKIRTITNDDVIDETTIIEIEDSENNLIAELIKNNQINANSYGLYGNNTNDDKDKLQALMNTEINKKLALDTNSIYKTSDKVLVKSSINGNKSTINGTLETLRIDNNVKDITIQDTNINSGNIGVYVNDAGASQEYSVEPNRNIIINNKITSVKGLRARTGNGGNTHNKNIFMMNNVKTTGGDNTDVGIESWNGDSTIAFNSIMKTGNVAKTGSSGITFGQYDGQKAIANIVEGFRYGIEVGGVGKNTLIFGNTIRNCQYGVGLTTNGHEKDTMIAYNYIEINSDSDYGIHCPGQEDAHINNCVIEWTGEGTIGGNGIRLDNNGKRAFIEHCIFKNIKNPIVVGTSIDELYISNCSFINCTNNLIVSQGYHIIIDKCYFEDCGVLYQNMSSTHKQKYVVQNSTFYHSNSFTGDTYVLSGRGQSTVALIESNNNTFINCEENPMKQNNITDGTSKRPLLFKKNGIYYSYNENVFSTLLTNALNVGIELQPGDKIYDNYLMITYEIAQATTRYGTDYNHYEYRSAVPNSGTFKKGDKVFNTLSSNTTVYAWLCTADGTFGDTDPTFTTMNIN